VSAQARRNFDAQDVTIACAAALLAQLVFVAVFSLPSPKLVQADISDDNAQPIAVAITPVLKLGSKNPTKLPSQWQRRQPVAAKTQPQSPLPSTKAEKTAAAIPTTSATVAAPVIDAGKVEPPPVASTEGSEQGAANGTETDPLKGRAADSYRQTLSAWFASHLDMRGKVPFDELKKLHAMTRIEVTPDRKVSGFTIVNPSGNPAFDGEVGATLSRIQSSGVEVPAPPPMYPEFLSGSLSVSFQCTVRAQCE
jgi:hypothetical protein